MKLKKHTPGTRGGLGGRDRTLAEKEENNFLFGKNKNYLKKNFFLHISSSYAKISGEKLFHTREILRSGSKAEDGEREKEKERERESESW